MRAIHSFINYSIALITLLGIYTTNAHLEQESIKSTAGVTVALPNSFFDSFTVQLIEALENRMLSNTFSLGTMRR